LPLVSLLLAAARAFTDSLIIEGASKTVVLRVKDVAALPRETVQAKIVHAALQQLPMLGGNDGLTSALT
jgi:hypothetical protein